MQVDREQKVIRGYSVMTIGDAIGHGVTVDQKTLAQLVELGNSKAGGVKTRVQHPNEGGDGFGRYLGKSRNFRIDGDQVRADLMVDDLAFKSPSGDWGGYLLDLADRAPDSFGASPEAVAGKEPIGISGKFAMRMNELLAIAIVDRPATNAGFFSVLPGDSTMADTTALETQVAELSAERDTLTKQAGEQKATIAKLEADLKTANDSKVVELSAAKTDAVAATLKSERNRVADILGLCSKAGKIDLAAKFITDGTPKADVQTKLFDVLCLSAQPIGDAGGNDAPATPDENKAYKAEFAALSAKDKAAFGDEAGYVQMRRIDDGLEVLTTKA